MRILVAPVLVGDRICRIVSPVDSLLEVEEWVGAWWEPSSVTLTTASQAPAAGEAVLRDRGVPPDDCLTTAGRTAEVEIQSLLRAREPVQSAPLSPDEPASHRAHGLRRKQYAGSARFRRHVANAMRDGLDRADLRRADPPAEWKGPWRRATDGTGTAEQDDGT